MSGNWTVVNEQKAAVLDAAVRTILKERGVWVHHPGMLEALAAKGAQVDPGVRRARLTDALIDEAVELQKSNGLAQEPGKPSTAGHCSQALGFEIAPVYYDFDTGAARNATLDDLVAMTRLGQMLPEVESVAAAVSVVGINQLLEPLESFLTVAANSDKPIGAVSLLALHNPYFERFGEILHGDRARYIGGGGWLPSPLCISERMGELMRVAPDYGKKVVGGGSMCIAGLSAPVTQAGAIVVGAAEILAGWVGALALQPRVTGFRSGVCTGVMDPRTSRGCFGGPEPVRQDVGICELFDHCYGGGVGVAGWGYVDGKVPGLQIAFEKVAKSLFIANARGLAPRIGSPGLIDAGRAFSPVQYLIDLEIDRALFGLYRDLDVSDEAVGLNAILEATETYGSSFIGLEHTARNFRDCLWMPALMDRSVNYPPADQRLEGKIAEAANARWKELVAAWQPVERTGLAQIEEVVRQAREELPKTGAGTFVA